MFFLKNKTVKNASWIIGGKIGQMVINLLVGIITARYLGPSNYGLINYASAYTAFFMAFCTLGINALLVKEFIDHPENEGKIIGTSLVLRAVSSLLSSMLIILIVSFLDAGEPVTIAVVALSSIGVVFHIFEVFNFWFQSRLQSKITALASFIAYFITALYKIILLLLGKSVVYFAFATSVDYICIAVFLFIAYFKFGGKRLKFSWKYGKSLLNRSHHFILSALMIAIYGQTDKLMLKQMLGESETGYYATAMAICNIWSFVLAAIIDSIHPSIMEANNKDIEVFKKKNRILYCIIFYVSISVSIFICLFAPLLISILYGKDFIPAINPLRIITWYTAFSYLGAARNAWVVCTNNQKYLKYIYALAAVSNVILNALLIPIWGASGAALASLVAQILTSIVLPLFITPLRENSILMIESIMFRKLR